MEKEVKVIVLKENDILKIFAENNPEVQVVITAEDNYLCVSEEN